MKKKLILFLSFFSVTINTMYEKKIAEILGLFGEKKNDAQKFPMYKWRFHNLNGTSTLKLEIKHLPHKPGNNKAVCFEIQIEEKNNESEKSIKTTSTNFYKQNTGCPNNKIFIDKKQISQKLRTNLFLAAKKQMKLIKNKLELENQHKNIKYSYNFEQKEYMPLEGSPLQEINESSK